MDETEVINIFKNFMRGNVEATDYEKIIKHLKNQLDDSQKENADMKARLASLNDSVVSSTRSSASEGEREAITVVYNPDKKQYERLYITYDLNAGSAAVRSEKLSKQMHVASFEGVQLLEKQLTNRKEKK